MFHRTFRLLTNLQCDWQSGSGIEAVATLGGKDLDDSAQERESPYDATNLKWEPREWSEALEARARDDSDG